MTPHYPFNCNDQKWGKGFSFIKRFVAESNRIEDIDSISHKEISAHIELVESEHVTVRSLMSFVEACSPYTGFRSIKGMDVRVGDHTPPPGGPQILIKLKEILRAVDKNSARQTHIAYETLHPFMDCNGRSGRALWLWKTVKRTGSVPPDGFLSTWNENVVGKASFERHRRLYYRSLSASREPGAHYKDYPYSWDMKNHPWKYP